MICLLKEKQILVRWVTFSALLAACLLAGPVSAYADEYKHRTHPHHPKHKTHKPHLLLDAYPYHHPYHKKKKKKDDEPPRSVTVDGKGEKKNHFKTFAGALKAVKAGGTVIVAPLRPGSGGVKGYGAYRESLKIGKPVSIIARLGTVRNHTARVIIEPPAGTPCADINMGGTVMIRGIDWVPARGGNADCIVAHTGRVVIEDNYFSGSGAGAAIRIKSHEAVLTENEIAHAGIGIAIETDPVAGHRRAQVKRHYTLHKNHIYKCGDGIRISGSELTDYDLAQPDLRLAHNEITECSGTGISIEGFGQISMEGNEISEQGQDGLVLINAGGAIRDNAVFLNGRHGLVLGRTEFRLELVNNKISDNGHYGLFLQDGIRDGRRARFLRNFIFGNYRCSGPRYNKRGIKIDWRSCFKNGRRHQRRRPYPD